MPLSSSLSPSHTCTSSNATYSINNQPIQCVDQHKDLGIIMTGNLTWSNHINAICSSAYRSLHLIRRSISSKDPCLRKRLYISLVRSRLIYCSQVWRPRLIKDIICLERVQRRATKYILNDYSSSYKSRLISLQLLPLMYWLEFHDLMFMIKCIKDSPDNWKPSDHITFISSSTRASNSNYLQHNYSRSTTTRHFYWNRIVPLWNSLASEIDLSLPIAGIKQLISELLWSHFIDHFDSDNPCSFHYLCPCSSCSLTSHA